MHIKLSNPCLPMPLEPQKDNLDITGAECELMRAPQCWNGQQDVRGTTAVSESIHC